MTKIQEEMKQHFRNMFGVDGYIRFHSKEKFNRKLNIGSIIELNDSKRGRFYVILAEAKDDTVLDQVKEKIEKKQKENQLNKAM